jgi:hypothetical protein
MIRVADKPSITFKCSSCSTVNEGDPTDFARQNTMPPTWLARCAFCGHRTRCSPEPLIALLFASLAQPDPDRPKPLPYPGTITIVKE